jgi:uncharacterized damage-inducible protein DinB
MAQQIVRPLESEYPAYYAKYVASVPNNDLLAYFATQKENLASLLATLPESKLLYKYAEGKWSIKDVAQHVIDSERIFAYRALSIARNDPHELPGFEENDYAAIANADARSGQDLASDFNAARAATIALYTSFDNEILERKGIANGKHVTVRALGYIIAGHDLHHLGVIKERYL